MSATPIRVSVIVPAYNAGRFLSQTLTSVLEQTFESWQCIVVDDGSTDDTRAIAERFCASDPRFRYVFQMNAGLSAARNRGLQMAAGDCVQFLDADDLIDASKFAVQVPLLDADPDLGVTYSNYRPFDDRTGTRGSPFFPDMLGSDVVEDFLFRWERGLSIPIHTAVFRAALWPDRRPFEESFRGKEDWLMWIDLALRGVRFAFVDRDLAFYRQHDQSLHRDPSMELVFLRAALHVLPRVPESLRERFLIASMTHVAASGADEVVRHLRAEHRAALEEVERLRHERPRATVAAPAPRSPSERVAACTILARNYLAQARILAESFLEHHPGARFYALVVDGLPDGESMGPGVRTIAPIELGVPYLEELTLKYDLVELCTALKPSLLSYLFSQPDVHRLVYLDPDIRVFRRLEEVEAALDRANIVLTPHSMMPTPLDGKRPTELDLLVTGIYNLGFLGVRRSLDTRRFLDWWTDRLRDGCRQNPPIGQFVDQKWVDLVPIYFDAVDVLRDDSYNVAYWNLHARRVDREGRTFTVEGRPLAFFHFSGVDLTTGQFRATHQDRLRVEPDSALALLIAQYIESVRRHGYDVSSAWTYGFSQFDNGQPIHWILRALYRDVSGDRRAGFGDVTKTREPTSFWQWAVTPDPAAGGLSPFLLKLYALRRDVSAAYPDVAGSDRERFLEWARSSGVREMGYDEVLVLPCLENPTAPDV